MITTFPALQAVVEFSQDCPCPLSPSLPSHQVSHRDVNLFDDEGNIQVVNFELPNIFESPLKDRGVCGRRACGLYPVQVHNGSKVDAWPDGLFCLWWCVAIYHVMMLHVQKCNECGQVLPESYEAPANEPWSSGIFGCTEDTESCWTGLFCPCVLFGRNIERLRDETPWTTPCICHAVCVEGGMVLAAATAFTYGIDPRATGLIWEGLFFAWWMCGIYTGLARQTLQGKYHLKNSPCDPCLVHCFMHWCALCQEHREMKSRLSDETDMPMTVISPPPVQEMTGRDNPLEVQAL